MDKQLEQQLAAIMHKVKGDLIPPGYKMTLVCRNTQNDGGKHVMITEDEPDAVCRTIQEVSRMVMLTRIIQ